MIIWVVTLVVELLLIVVIAELYQPGNDPYLFIDSLIYDNVRYYGYVL